MNEEKGEKKCRKCKRKGRIYKRMEGRDVGECNGKEFNKKERKEKKMNGSKLE
jgi:hypothetical protein